LPHSAHQAADHQIAASRNGLHGQQQGHDHVAAHMPASDCGVATDQGLQGGGADQQATENHAHPEMGLPKQQCPGLVAKSLHRRMQAQAKHPAPAGSTPDQSLPNLVATQQSDVADHHRRCRQQQRSIGLAKKAAAEADQHRHQNSAGHPGAVLGMFKGHRVRNRVDLQSPFPRQDSQPDRRPHHGIDEQDHQHRVNQSEPVVPGECLQCLGISQKKPQPLSQVCASWGP